MASMPCDPSGRGIMPAWMFADPAIVPSGASTVRRIFVGSLNKFSQRRHSSAVSASIGWLSALPASTSGSRSASSKERAR